MLRWHHNGYRIACFGHFTPPKGYKGGKVLRSRKGKMPRDEKYREYDVHPVIQNQSRGAGRLVIDEQKTLFYYTKDHYRTFVKVIPK
jgi:guanyl-specific ribonuclease Sa